MSAQQRPKVGETVTVQVAGKVTRHEGDTFCVGGDLLATYAWVTPEHIVTTPTPRQPWDVLREAAAICVADYDGGAARLLRAKADHLEAAAKPKPTLREAAKRLSGLYAFISVESPLPEAMRDEVRLAWHDLDEALVREEPGT